jgi:hypothetical protein
MNDPLAPVEEIMRRHNVRSTAAEFHAAVNVCFHRFESEVYDQLHRGMWESLAPQVENKSACSTSDAAPDSPSIPCSAPPWTPH